MITIWHKWGNLNVCGSVRNDEIINLHLGSSADSLVSILCLLQGTSRIHWFHLVKRSTKKKQNIPEKRWNSRYIISFFEGHNSPLFFSTPFLSGPPFWEHFQHLNYTSNTPSRKIFSQNPLLKPKLFLATWSSFHLT